MIFLRWWTRVLPTVTGNRHAKARQNRGPALLPVAFGAERPSTRDVQGLRCGSRLISMRRCRPMCWPAFTGR